MADILVYALHYEGAFNKNSLGAVSEARAARGRARRRGARDRARRQRAATSCARRSATTARRKVLRVEGPEGLAQPVVDAMAAADRAAAATATRCSAAACSASRSAPAWRRGSAPASRWRSPRVRAEDGELIAERPILGDSAISEIDYRSEVGIIIGRLNAFEIAAPSDAATRRSRTSRSSFSDFSTRATMISRGEQRGADVDIEGADILVAGGRGLGKAEGFELCEELAAAFGGNSAVAATRAVVDAGWYPYAAQIGQTGKTVAPKLYLAAGISGAIQHKVGMQASENIVAINKDANAPIFEFSDLGIVGDLNKILPKLTEAVKAQEGAASGVPRNGSSNGKVVAGGLPAAGRLARGSSSSASSTARTSGSRSASRSSAAAPPGSPARTGCCSCSPTTPRRSERLGEVPVAVIEKAKACGGHNLSGAVMRPEPLQDLFPELDARAVARARASPSARSRRRPSTCCRRPSARLRIPTPPPFSNHGNEVVSVSALARFQQQQAEEAGAYVLTETAATPADRRGRRRRRRALRRQGPRQGRRAAGELRARHRHQGARDGARRGLLGAPDRRGDPRVRPRRRTASRRSGSSASRRSGRSPSRSTGVIHTIGPWPLKLSPTLRPDRRHLDLPDEERATGEDLVSIGFVVELEYADATTSAHDLLQTFKTAPARARDPRGRRARRVGREGAARRRLLVDAEARRCRARCSSATPAGWSTRWR